MANKLKPKEPNPFDGVIEAQKQQRQALEDLLWQQSDNDLGLFELLLRHHNLSGYIAKYLDEGHPDWAGAQAELKELVYSIDNYGMPVNSVDTRAYLNTDV